MIRTLGLGFALTVVVAAVNGQPARVQPPVPAAGGNKAGWTTDEALRLLARSPSDPYLQYVAIQVARREGRAQEAVSRLMRGRFDLGGRRDRTDLFNTFTGALAIQESLQLDTLLGDDDMMPGLVPPGIPNAPPPPMVKGFPVPTKGDEKSAPRPAPKSVPIDTLSGPTVKSHPWEQMLAGRRPEAGPLAQCVPEDFYFVEFKSVTKLLQALSVADIWGDHLFTQMLGQANSQDTERRLKKQLGIAGLPPELIDAMGVEGIAVTGSDLYLADGSDVTLLVLGRQVVRMRQWADAALNRDRAKREDGEYLGVKYARAFTDDGAVNVYTADPRPDLHVRSNSLPAFRKVLAAIAGKDERGAPVRRLGDTAEFAYIRTILPRGDAAEDGIIYLSDPCIRRLVGPRVKLAQRRRLTAFTHLKMIEHAALMFRTETGHAAKSLAELAALGCAPGVFGKDKLAHPQGGTYTLAADGMSATSSVYSRAGSLTPLLEVPIAEVSESEAAAYQQFRTEYDQYWRTYFDPIAVRIKVTPQQYRLETVVLPLIDNSIYTAMAAALAGPPTALDPLPASKKAILTLALRLNKQPVLEMLPPDPEAAKGQPVDSAVAVSSQSARNMQQILLAMHNYHAVQNHFPPVDLRFLQPNPPRDGKPLLSWRVALLPYLEQGGLYNEFHHDEPWDSEHNKKLIARIPTVYRGRDPKHTAAGKTPFVVPVGKNTVFTPDGAKMGIQNITDGTSNTIGLVETTEDRAVVWTKPDDLEIDTRDPLKGLLAPGQDSFLVGMCDGSVQHFRGKIPTDVIRAMLTRDGGEPIGDLLAQSLPVPGQSRGPLGLFDLNEFVSVAKLRRFLRDGIGDQVALHVLDAAQPIGTEVSSVFGSSDFMQGMGLRMGGAEMAAIALIASSLTNPVCLSLPVKDAKAVDDFLDDLDHALAEKLPSEIGFPRPELYRLNGPGPAKRVLAFKFFGLTLRVCWGRVGNSLCVANQPSVFDDITGTAAVNAESREPAHALLRIRPENWNAVLPVYRLGWAEGQRVACLANQTRIANVARGWPALAKGGEVPADLLQRVTQLYGVRPFCPDVGTYILADGGTCTCSVHGGWSSPRQSAAPNDDSATAKMIRAFGGLSATLLFREDGLHAVVTIDRK